MIIEIISHNIRHRLVSFAGKDYLYHRLEILGFTRKRAVFFNIIYYGKYWFRCHCVKKWEYLRCPSTLIV